MKKQVGSAHLLFVTVSYVIVSVVANEYTVNLCLLTYTYAGFILTLAVSPV